MAIGSKFRGGSNSSNAGEDRAEGQQAAAQGEKEPGGKDIGSFLWPFYVIGVVILIAVAVSTIYDVSLFAVVNVAVVEMAAHLVFYFIPTLVIFILFLGLAWGMKRVARLLKIISSKDVTELELTSVDSIEKHDDKL